ncbi:MAG: group II intron reverse transcriptase/maturase [Verrucomicrobia bacterium]|nr:group II intron reverse transcriptase/maturase [Verrucomicrobiota bacterium]
MSVFVPNQRKVHSLTGRITPKLVLTAFKAVKRNRGAAGIDKVSIQMFEQNLDANLASLLRDLKDGSFKPFPLRRHYLDKGDGKWRPLGIPAVRDRVAQEVVRCLLTPIFTPLFHDASFGFIQGRNCHQACARVLQYHQEGFGFVLDADIRGFFDNLPLEIIMAAVAAQVADGNILCLIEKFLRAGVMENGVFKPTTIGTPQGGVISPLLANIVLNHLDWQLQAHGYRFVRYADDFVVVTQTHAQAEEARKLVEQTLAQLGLQLSAEKTQITTFGKGYSFLGFVLSRRSRRMRPKSVKKLQDRMRELTIRHHNLEAAMIEKLNQVIRGTALYFTPHWATTRWQLRRLDGWIRMRVRAMWRKRKKRTDNYRLTTVQLAQRGLISLENFC